jgi:Fibronectin type III domain
VSRPLLPILLLLLLLLPGCGKKGPLRPKLAPLPAAPGDFSARQLGGELLLSWTLPAANQDGSPLEDLRLLRLYRSEFEPAEECPECRDTSVLHLEIDLDYLQQVRRRGSRLRFSDEAIAPDRGYRYRLVAVGAAGQEGAPVRLRVVVLPPPPAPDKLVATPLDRQVRLSWHPLSPQPGTTLIGYNVYRRTPAEAYGEAPVNLTPLTATSYDQFGLENDQPYVFGVRSLVQKGAERVESALAETGTIVPQIGQ